MIKYLIFRKKYFGYSIKLHISWYLYSAWVPYIEPRFGSISAPGLAHMRSAGVLSSTIYSSSTATLPVVDEMSDEIQSGSPSGSRTDGLRSPTDGSVREPARELASSYVHSNSKLIQIDLFNFKLFVYSVFFLTFRKSFSENNSTRFSAKSQEIWESMRFWSP